MEKTEMICIVCPMGCRIEIMKNNGHYMVTGNKCPRGQEYGIKELTNPTRVITSTVKLKNGILKRLPVKTNQPIPKDKIHQCMRVLDGVEITSPVEAGQIIVEDILGTGAHIVATRNMCSRG